MKETITINILTPDGVKNEINIDSNAKISDLRTIVAEKLAINKDQLVTFRLFFSGKELYDNKTLSDYKILNNNTVHAIQRVAEKVIPHISEDLENGMGDSSHGNGRNASAALTPHQYSQGHTNPLFESMPGENYSITLGLGIGLISGLFLCFTIYKQIKKGNIPFFELSSTPHKILAGLIAFNVFPIIIGVSTLTGAVGGYGACMLYNNSNNQSSQQHE